jgi:anti-repressor protein
MTKLTTKTAFEAAVIPQDREGHTMIDARQLHAWLGVKDRFHQWVQRRVTEYGFEEGTDFCTNMCKTRGRPRTDYLLTLDTAKEVAMVERTERGRMTRRYFIEMERSAHQMAATLATQGQSSAIPDSFFDAKAEITSLREELMRLLDERLPAARIALAGAL